MWTVKKKPRTFWSRVNDQISRRDRKAFNKWRAQLYLAADRNREASRMHQSHTNAEELVKIVCDIPYFLDENDDISEAIELTQGESK